MDTATLRDWATRNGTDLEPGADRTLGLTSRVIRLRRDGVPTIAVGSDAGSKTRIDSVLDGVAWVLSRYPDARRLDLVLGVTHRSDTTTTTTSWCEQLGAIGTLIASLRDGPQVRVSTIEPDEVVTPLGVSAAVFTTSKPRKWAVMLDTAAERQVVGLAADLMDAVGHPSVALYPKLSSKSTATPWQIRIDGLDIGRVGATSGTLRLATRDLNAHGRPRKQWRDVVVDPMRPFEQSTLDATVETIGELIAAFSDGTSGVLNHGQPEHGLEAHVLDGRLPLTTNTGLRLRLAVAAHDHVLRAGQFPTLWGDVTGPARYLDALLADDAGRPWAIELKDQYAGGGNGAYLRAGIGQAVLYRHYIRNVTELAHWFQRHGLDHTKCQAAVAFPTAPSAACGIVNQHIDLATRFDIDVIQFDRP
jgi:hypothetical protein